MVEEIEGIKLSREQFGKLNDCDGLAIFALETDRHLASILDEELHKFDYLDHFCYLMDKLYRKFEYITVSPENKFYGFRNGNYKYLYEAFGAYEKATGL